MAATPKQMEIMLQFVDEHPQLANNYVANSVQGRQAINNLWATLANKLNASGLPNKSTASWRKVWTDCKYRAKRKCSRNLSSMRKTGGGPSEEVPLSPIEEKVVALASLREAVAGSSSECFGAPNILPHPDIVAADVETLSADDDFSVVLCLSPTQSEDNQSKKSRKRNTTEFTSASTPKRPTPKRKQQTGQNERVEILKSQYQTDKVFQKNLLTVLTERNQQESLFQAKVIQLLEKRNEIAEKQLELDSNTINFN